jgi:hypothetical protein
LTNFPIEHQGRLINKEAKWCCCGDSQGTFPLLATKGDASFIVIIRNQQDIYIAAGKSELTMELLLGQTATVRVKNGTREIGPTKCVCDLVFATRMSGRKRKLGRGV